MLGLARAGFEQSLKVGRGNSSSCSVDEYHDLVVDVSFDWKPVECAEEPGELGKVEHQVGCSILDNLQGFDVEISVSTWVSEGGIRKVVECHPHSNNRTHHVRI